MTNRPTAEPMRVKRNNQHTLPNNNNQKSAPCHHLSGAKINVIYLILLTDYFLSSCVVVAIAHVISSQHLGPWWCSRGGDERVEVDFWLCVGPNLCLTLLMNEATGTSWWKIYLRHCTYPALTVGSVFYLYIQYLPVLASLEQTQLNQEYYQLLVSNDEEAFVTVV